jgi:general secretion pathway protein M
MQKLREWFYGLKPRERWMVAGAGVLVVLSVAYLFVLAPFYAAVDAQAERVAKKQADVAWMRSVAGDVIALSRDAPMAAVPTGESLVVVVDRTARECGLGSSLTGQTPNGTTGIRVRLERAEFDKLVLCLANLQQGHAVSIESATIDRTSEPGFVNASLVLNRAAG